MPLAGSAGLWELSLLSRIKNQSESLESSCLPMMTAEVSKSLNGSPSPVCVLSKFFFFFFFSLEAVRKVEFMRASPVPFCAIIAHIPPRWEHASQGFGVCVCLIQLLLEAGFSTVHSESRPLCLPPPLTSSTSSPCISQDSASIGRHNSDFKLIGE